MSFTKNNEKRIGNSIDRKILSLDAMIYIYPNVRDETVTNKIKLDLLVVKAKNRLLVLYLLFQ